ncbi:MAG: hypothetical protein IJX62_09170 [Clostridia bacterium]|nr:hypothetical protein [Clostridia bacterium]
MKQQKIPFPGPAARAVLHIQLPLVLLSAVTLLIAYLQARESAPAYANLFYPYQLEYLVASLPLCAASFWLVDAAERQAKTR